MNTARFLKHVWSVFNNMHERFKDLDFKDFESLDFRVRIYEWCTRTSIVKWNLHFDNIHLAVNKFINYLHLRLDSYTFCFYLFYLESAFFIRSLPCSSFFSPAWNLGSLLGPVRSQYYRWSHNLPIYWRVVTSNWYWTHALPKFVLQGTCITGVCY